jgi:hypothetical protein
LLCRWPTTFCLTGNQTFLHIWHLRSEIWHPSKIKKSKIKKSNFPPYLTSTLDCSNTRGTRSACCRCFFGVSSLGTAACPMVRPENRLLPRPVSGGIPMTTRWNPLWSSDLYRTYNGLSSDLIRTKTRKWAWQV